MPPTHYERLNVNEDTSPGELYDAWQAELQRVKETHSGISQAVAMAELNEAYRLLSDRDRRAAYDRRLAERRGESEGMAPSGDGAAAGAAAFGAADFDAPPAASTRAVELEPGTLQGGRAPGQDSHWLVPDDMAAPADSAGPTSGRREPTGFVADARDERDERDEREADERDAPVSDFQPFPVAATPAEAEPAFALAEPRKPLWRAGVAFAIGLCAGVLVMAWLAPRVARERAAENAVAAAARPVSNLPVVASGAAVAGERSPHALWLETARRSAAHPLDGEALELRATGEASVPIAR